MHCAKIGHQALSHTLLKLNWRDVGKFRSSRFRRIGGKAEDVNTSKYIDASDIGWPTLWNLKTRTWCQAHRRCVMIWMWGF
jgi:hypothetical protein